MDLKFYKHKKIRFILMKLKSKFFSIFSSKNIYVILLVGLWPALFFYFNVFSYDNLLPEYYKISFLILGIIALVVALISLIYFKNRKIGVVNLVLFLLFGFLGIRLVEFYQVGEGMDAILEETAYFYLWLAFIILFIYLSIKIYKNFYTGKIVVLAAIIFSFIGWFTLGNISALMHEKQTAQNAAEGLSDVLMLYTSSPPQDWKTYIDNQHNFFFFYPPTLSYDFVKENVDVKVMGNTEKQSSNSFDEIWTSECFQKMNREGEKFLLCPDSFRGEQIYFIRGDNLVKVFLQKNITTRNAEFFAIINSFGIY